MDYPACQHILYGKLNALIRNIHIPFQKKNWKKERTGPRYRPRKKLSQVQIVPGENMIPENFLKKMLAINYDWLNSFYIRTCEVYPERIFKKFSNGNFKEYLCL